MCQSEKISWCTWALGTLLNTGILLCLWLAPPVEPVLSRQGTTAVAVYQYALTVQVADALNWRRVKQDKAPSPWFAYFLVTTQPLAAGLASLWTWSDDAGNDKIALWAVFSVVILGMIVVAAAGPKYLGIEVGIRVTENETSKLEYLWHNSKIYNAFYSLGVLIGPFVMWSPWVVPGSFFAQVLAGYLGSLSFGISAATASFWCWTSFPSGALSAGAAYSNDTAVEIGLYIALTFLFTALAIPYRVYRLFSKSSKKRARNDAYPSFVNKQIEPPRV